MLRLYEIPFSTNVERVALAAAFKGLELEHVSVPEDDRSAVEAVSGQRLVPVLDHDGEIVCDSTAILRHLDERFPAPPLFPFDRARRAELDVFLDWFNRVWKRPPNAIDAELDLAEPDTAAIAASADEMKRSLDLFERLLAGRDFLFGDFSAADCAAFPFLKYALLFDEADDERFHRILRDNLPLQGDQVRLAAWIRRVDALPRA
jgi:glutathione S-transferase